jgi:hypothetical protein
MSGVVLKDLAALQDLLNYCQSNGRVCLQPHSWEKMFSRFRMNKKYVVNRFPPNQPILGGWTDDNKYKRLLFLTHVYWAYEHNLFGWVDRYIRSCNDNKWNIDTCFLENNREVGKQYCYVRLNVIKEEYNNSWPTSNPGL